MSAITINPSNLQRYHNAIIYGASENEIREHFKEAIGCGKPDGMPLAHLVAVINNYRNDIENRYETFRKAKVKTIEEYNKANPNNKMEHVVIYVYGKSKDFAECIELLACMQKSWAAGYRFAIGVTDGNNPGLIKDVAINCEYIEDLTCIDRAAKLSDYQDMRNICVYGENDCTCFTRLLMEEIKNKILTSYPTNIYSVIPSLEKIMNERFKRIYLTGYNDIYEYDEDHPGEIEPLTVFIKHCNDKMLFDELIVHMVARAYNAGIYFVFCYDEIPEFKHNEFEATSGKVVTFKGKHSTNEDHREEMHREFDQDKIDSLECMKKYETGRLFMPTYLDAETFFYLYENHAKRYFYIVDKEKNDIVDIFED